VSFVLILQDIPALSVSGWCPLQPARKHLNLFRQRVGVPLGLAAGSRVSAVAVLLLEQAIGPSVALRPGNTDVCSRSRLGFLLTNEVTVGADAQKVDEHRNHVPDDHRPRSNQQAVVDPEDLKDSHDCRHPRVHSRA